VADLVFLGTPEAAVPSLEALVAAGHRIRLVVSRPDVRRGRGPGTAPSPVKAAAIALGLPVSDRLEDVVGVGAELGVVVAYGRIVPQRVLDALAMVNVHFSLLPRWRGAAPVERAILAGDDVTGVCIMRLDAGLDTGPILARVVVPIRNEEREHARALTARLAAAGAELLVATLAGGVAALGPGEPQVGEPTYAAKLEPEELRIDWSQPASVVERVVRLDRAWTTFRGQRLRILRARAVDGEGTVVPAASADAGHQVGAPGTLAPDGTVVAGTGALILEEVQPPGRRPMAAADWLRGIRLQPGERLGATPPTAPPRGEQPSGAGPRPAP